MAFIKVPTDPDDCGFKCTAELEEAVDWLAKLGQQYEAYTCLRCKKYHFRIRNYVPPQAH